MTIVPIGALLLGPTALAFFTGGYYDNARAWAGLGAWALAGIAAVVTPAVLPRARAARIGLAGLALLAAWTLLSTTWALAPGYAYHAGQLAFLYLGALLASALWMRERPALRALEPTLAGGTLVVIGYGLSERFFPGVLHFAHSVTAGGRLEQPLTYWNAMGELAAIGFVLAVRLAGDRSRPPILRALSAAGTVPLGLGLYLSFSRGALFAAASGLLALIVLARSREQLRALIVAVAGAVIASAACSPFGSVTEMSGKLGTRETQGAILCAVVVIVMVAAGVVEALLVRRERPARLNLPDWSPVAVTGLICLALALAIVLGAKETSHTQYGGGASRLTSLQSDRYAYWRVAFRAFAAEPLHGVGAENWFLYWLRYRPTDGAALDTHSLELQTLAELGVVGIACLAAFLVGIGVAARRAYRLRSELTAGPLAGAIVWLVHTPLDWDWQIPAVTLLAMGLGGALLALSDVGRRDPVPPPRAAGLSG